MLHGNDSLWRGERAFEPKSSTISGYPQQLTWSQSELHMLRCVEGRQQASKAVDELKSGQAERLGAYSSASADKAIAGPQDAGELIEAGEGMEAELLQLLAVLAEPTTTLMCCEARAEVSCEPARWSASSVCDSVTSLTSFGLRWGRRG